MVLNPSHHFLLPAKIGSRSMRQKPSKKELEESVFFSDFHVCCVYVSKMPFSFNGVAHIIMGREASHTCLNVHFSREGIALSVCPIDFSLTIFLFLENSAQIDK